MLELTVNKFGGGEGGLSDKLTQTFVFPCDSEILGCLMMADNHLGLFTNCLIMFGSLFCAVLGFYPPAFSSMLSVFSPH